MSKKKSKASAEDIALFLQAIKGTTPIKQDKHGLQKTPPSVSLKKELVEQNRSDEAFRFVSQAILAKIDAEDWLTAEDTLHFARRAISHRTLVKLRRGQFGVEAKLDLHGLSGDAALSATHDFISTCQLEDTRNLLIVHGKGKMMPHKGAILKNLLNQWLRQQPEVLAFCSARPGDGGQGAVYVLLKRRKNDNER